MVQVEVAQARRLSYDLRRAMVDNQIRTFDVTDQRVLQAFLDVPREGFLPENVTELTYSDAPVTIDPPNRTGEVRVLLPPLFLAKLIQNASVTLRDRVLVVGAASGYTAAILARLAGSVLALESDPGFFSATVDQLAELSLPNVGTVQGPLAQGYPAGGPYDVVLVDGAVECNLEALLDQLAPQGRLLAILTKSSSATRRSGKAVRFDKIGGDISSRDVFDATAPVLAEFRERPSFIF